MKKINWKVLVFSLIAVFLVASFGSLFTTGNVESDWYIENKPAITPPNWVFGPAWTTLYILIAISLYFAWTNSKKKEKMNIGLIYGINLVLNASWSYFFFGLQNPVLGLVCLSLIWLTIWGMIYFAWRVDRRAAWLLVPYLLWVTFAGVLNAGFL